MLCIYIKKYIPSFFPPPPKTLNNCNPVMVHYSHSGNNESGVEKVVSWEGDNLAAGLKCTFDQASGALR